MHDGVWDKSADGSHEIRGRTLGIVGYGNIGTQLSVLAENLGMQVSFYDTADKLALGNARRCASLEELLDTVDMVTLHVDGRAGNAGIFGAEQFARMRPGSLFLNLSRGFVVDYDALRDAIESGPPGRRRGRRVPDRAEGAAATSSTPRCAGCPTSSSPRTSAARPRRRRRTSAASSAPSCATTCSDGQHALIVNLPTLTLAAAGSTRSGSRTCTSNTPGVLAHGQPGARRARREHRGSAARPPAASSATWSPTPAPASPTRCSRGLRAMTETIRLRVID